VWWRCSHPSKRSLAVLAHWPAWCGHGLRTHKLCRTAERHHADVDAPIHSFDECVLERVRALRGSGGAPLHALQLCADSQDAPRDASDGGWPCWSRMIAQ
jgi:hypothetical protein